MTREQHLVFCKICINKSFHRDKGITCGLTNEIATFETSCDNFQSDTQLESINTELNTKEVNALDLASKEKRFLNYLIDLAVLYLLSIVIGFIIGILWGIISPETVDAITEYEKALGYVIGAIAILIYYTIIEYLTGKSVGKYFTKTKVIDLNGNLPNFKKVLIRSFSRIIPFEAFTFLGKEGSGLHDKLSKTRVINN
jgi:uncharacterized RDD family membrane protein YckC